MERPRPVPSPAGFVVKNGLNIFSFTSGWNTGAVVANPDFHTIAKTFGRGSKGWHVVSAVRFRLAFGRFGTAENAEARTRGIQFVEHTEGDGREMFKAVCKLGLEGMVSKKLNALLGLRPIEPRNAGASLSNERCVLILL